MPADQSSASSPSDSKESPSSSSPPLPPPTSEMAERKVSSKYYPPDFDPSAIAGRSKKKDAGRGLKTEPVRLMAPFSMKCLNCAEYIYKGRKFNARKEILDETYFNIKLHRFYIKCTGCKHEITFKTDPKSGDYTCERGAQRNAEAWRDPNDPKYKEETEQETIDRLAAQIGEEGVDEDRDKMAELEDKMKDSKREMQVADALDEIRSRNARIERNEATDKKVVAPKKSEKVYLQTPVGPCEFESQEELDAFQAEVKQKAYEAFHDKQGNRLKRDGDGNIIRRYTPQEEAAGLHLIDDKPGAKKINLPAPIPEEEDEIIGEEPWPWSDDEITAEYDFKPKNKKAKTQGDRSAKIPRKK